MVMELFVDDLPGVIHFFADRFVSISSCKQAIFLRIRRRTAAFRSGISSWLDVSSAELVTKINCEVGLAHCASRECLFGSTMCKNAVIIAWKGALQKTEPHPFSKAVKRSFAGGNTRYSRTGYSKV